MLLSWVAAGYAVTDLGDGSWGWTIEGKKIPEEVRTILSDALYGAVPKRWMLSLLNKNLFDENGFALMDE